MPMYSFQLVGGTETRDEFFRVADMPELGQTIVRDGKTWMRVLSTPQISASVARVCRGYPFESHQFGDVGDAATKSPRGLTVVESQQHHKKLAEMHGHKFL